MARKFNPAVKMAAGAAFDAKGNPKPHVTNAIMKALDVQRPLVLANLNRLRRKYPEASPAELSAKLEKSYLAAVTGGGAAVGGSALVPGVGTVAALGLSAAATVGFLEATALYAQSIAELHGIQLDDPDRARTMVMAILMGEEGLALIRELAGAAGGRAKPGQTWGSIVGTSMPSGMVGTVVDSMRRRFLKKILAKQGTAMLGRAVPFGIGAVVGGAGNHVMGRKVIAATREAFGEPPLVLPMGLVEELAQKRHYIPRRNREITAGTTEADTSLTDRAAVTDTAVTGNPEVRPEDRG
ncbi:hypothetical protein D477_001149 [Arthrobacter crystallopoietes BAB-32]|uniref:Di-and tripeptidase n=1 Tax=Arthrobacter crystallopoietes BAB-32 TaxID=1246476 RepID=N1V067_9MICC|nr:hypothetical protein [Arthrobacter crystallopoietes]EMY36046.1 hypothetical protein D477_001149 [Arthrobacter crystallopoietes BAB-32]